MVLRIITADERLAASHNKDTAVILGPYGIGKTSLLYTLPEDSTLFLNFEAGEKAVMTWRGDTIELRTFNDTLDIACLIGGPNPALRSADPFSIDHYDAVKKTYAGLDLDKYRVIFFDSISDMTHVAMQFALTRPVAISDKTGKDDMRGAYGELGRQVIWLLKHMQHTPGKDIIFVGRLERIVDDFGRQTWQPQMMGGMVARELPSIVDHVISMSAFDYDEKGGWTHNADTGTHRAFVCHKINPFGLPAKTRSEHLDLIEEPHLGRLLAKINLPARAAAERLHISLAVPALPTPPISSPQSQLPTL